MIYERRWALTVLEQVLSRLKDEYQAADNAILFDSLKNCCRMNRVRRHRRRSPRNWA